MPASWIQAGVSLLGAFGSGDSSGGTQTVNKDPWAPAQDWMKQNLTSGQNLQNYYQQNPFNQQQQAAYGNLASSNDYLNRLTPNLLQQFSQPTGFDRNNPTARPAPFNFFAPSQSSSPPNFPSNAGSNLGSMGGGFFGGAGAAPIPRPVSQQGDAYGGSMRQSMPDQGNLNQSSNPFANGGVPTMAQASMPSVQQMVNDALAAQRSSGLNGQQLSDQLGGGYGGG